MTYDGGRYFLAGTDREHMGVTTDGDPDKAVTLAFELDAFREFANPAAVVEDAREWSRHVGVIGNDADAVRAYLDERGIDHDFEPGDRDKWLALEEIRAATDTPRHVFVGRSTDDRRAAEHTGWEFVHVREAARKAGWTRSERPTGGSGPVDRIRAALRSLRWPFGRR